MKNFIYEKVDSIGIVKINRPEVLNALNIELLEELQIFIDIIAKSHQVRALILTGEGNKAFIAGADIKEMQGMNHLEMMQFCKLGQQVTLSLEKAPFLCIAAVNGYALGGGLEMALACDFIYASKTAKLGLPEITLGIIPGFGGTQRLPRAIGARKAKEMILNGKMITAEEALNIGIVNRICEPDTLLQECIEAADNIARQSFTAIMEAKQAINVGLSLPIHEALELEKNMCGICFDTPERESAIKAFLEKKTAASTK